MADAGHVLILSLVFPPDNVSTAHLMGDIARDLAARGHRVSVISTTPHYNRDEVAEVAQPLRRMWGGLLYRSDYAGIPVYHVPMPPKGRSSVRRVLSWAWFHVMSVIAGVLLLPRVHAILTPSPPLTMGLASWALGLVRRAPFVYAVFELHPDIIISMGLVRQPLVIRLLYAMERFVYARSAHLTVTTPAMERRIREKGVPADKVTYLPNFVDTEETLLEPRPNAFSRAHDLDGRFVVSYAGNVGLAQGLEPLLDAALLLRDLDDVRIVIVGGGVIWDDLKARIETEHLDNVILLPHQPLAAVPAIYGASDVCVVAQSAGTTSDAVPSKVYRIMGASLPVLALTTPDSDLAMLVREAGAGAVVGQDGEEIAAAVRDAVARPDVWRARGAAGRRHVEAKYSRRVITAGYADVIERVRSRH